MAWGRGAKPHKNTIGICVEIMGEWRRNGNILQKLRRRRNVATSSRESWGNLDIPITFSWAEISLFHAVWWSNPAWLPEFFAPILVSIFSAWFPNIVRFCGLNALPRVSATGDRWWNWSTWLGYDMGAYGTCVGAPFAVNWSSAIAVGSKGNTSCLIPCKFRKIPKKLGYIKQLITWL
jgi:hypothetical protein